jgi:hypothetical protein
MGAQDFVNEYRGPGTAEEAFQQVREQAFYDYGHAGYTGTIAEAPGYVYDLGMPGPVLADVAYERAREWERDDFPQKWSAAAAIKLAPEPDWVDPHAGRYATPYDRRLPGWLFYGVASA